MAFHLTQWKASLALLPGYYCTTVYQNLLTSSTFKFYLIVGRGDSRGWGSELPGSTSSARAGPKKNNPKPALSCIGLKPKSSSPLHWRKLQGCGISLLLLSFYLKKWFWSGEALAAATTEVCCSLCLKCASFMHLENQTPFLFFFPNTSSLLKFKWDLFGTSLCYLKYHPFSLFPSFIFIKGVVNYFPRYELSLLLFLFSTL